MAKQQTEKEHFRMDLHDDDEAARYIRQNTSESCAVAVGHLGSAWSQDDSKLDLNDGGDYTMATSIMQLADAQVSSADGNAGLLDLRKKNPNFSPSKLPYTTLSMILHQKKVLIEMQKSQLWAFAFTWENWSEKKVLCLFVWRSHNTLTVCTVFVLPHARRQLQTKIRNVRIPQYRRITQ